MLCHIHSTHSNYYTHSLFLLHAVYYTAGYYTALYSLALYILKYFMYSTVLYLSATAVEEKGLVAEQ